jgi:O-antigen/teichoic acid export membrane protein
VAAKLTHRKSNAEIAVRNSAFGLLSLGSRLVGNLVVFIVITRLPSIDVAGFGQLTYAFALASLFVLMSQFGLVQLVIRDVAADRNLLGDYVRAVIGLRLLLSVIGLAALASFVNMIDMTAEARLVCYLIGVAMYIGSLSIDIQALFQSQERMHLELLGIVFENVLLLALALSAFLFLPGVIGVAWIFLAAKTAALFLNYLVCGRRLLWITACYDRATWRRLLGQALPFALTGLFAAGIVQIDTLLLRQFASAGEEAVGIYQAAVRLFIIPMLLPEIVSKVFLPQLSRMHGGKGIELTRDLGRINHILITLGMLVSLVTVFRAEDLIQIIYGDKYHAAGALLQVLGVSIAMRFGTAYSLYFVLRDRVWFRVWTALLALAVVIVLNVLFIPRYGAIGAAYASIFAHVIYWIPYLVALFAAERSILLGFNPLRAFGVTMVLAIVLYLSSAVSLLLMLPVYAILCVVGTFASMPMPDRKLIVIQLRKSLTL